MLGNSLESWSRFPTSVLAPSFTNLAELLSFFLKQTQAEPASFAMATKDVKGMPEERPVQVPTNSSSDIPQGYTEEEAVKRPWWHGFKTPGHALQIISAALVAIAIGLIVVTQVDEVPEAAIVILSIIGNLWLRALKAVGKFPQIICNPGRSLISSQSCH